MTSGELENQIISASGISMKSANKVIVGYKFMINDDGFEQNLTSMNFIYRPSGSNRQDVPVLYLSTKDDPWLRNVLRNLGTDTKKNEAARRIFADQMAFTQLVDQGELTEVSGETVREDFDGEGQKMIRKIRRLTYEER